MSTRTENPTTRPAVDGVKGARILVVESRFYPEIADALISGAEHEIRKNGATLERVVVPGAFEIPLAARRLAASGEFDAVICLGAVIRGDTAHFEHVAGQCAAGIQRAQLDTGVPVVFGVLTTDTIDQALERAGSKAGNKGYEAAEVAVEMADLLRQLPKGGPA